MTHTIYSSNVYIYMPLVKNLLVLCLPCFLFLSFGFLLLSWDELIVDCSFSVPTHSVISLQPSCAILVSIHHTLPWTEHRRPCTGHLYEINTRASIVRLAQTL